MSFTRRYDGPEPQRVNKWLAQSGVCSRREAEALIARGQVSIDGERISDAGHKIGPGQILTLTDEATSTLSSSFCILLHKPVGYVSGQPEPGDVPAARLLTRDRRHDDAPVPPSDASLPPLGRLDKDSRGLLLLSDDGVLAKALIGPQSQLDKQYRVIVRGQITQDKLARLRHGLELDGRRLKPAIVTRLTAQTLSFTLTEGRNRQIRRMCELVDLRVVDLYRHRIGPLELGDLPEGRWRALSAQERDSLIAASGG